MACIKYVWRWLRKRLRLSINDLRNQAQGGLTSGLLALFASLAEWLCRASPPFQQVRRRV
jgi:hypothetical protein